MQRIYPDVRAAGGEVLVISFSPPRVVARYLERYPQPFPVVSDPDLTAYRGFALGRTSWLAFFRPDVLARYLWHIFRGWMPRAPESKEDDLLQLGGDFVIDRHDRIVYVYRSREATDRPAAEELLQSVRVNG